ncbi:hypothetical protein BGX23_005809 [Mortierella sp. AD031]|nr:hypothetical protein BGX23_005809 [Mortierella sp. AD031]
MSHTIPSPVLVAIPIHVDFVFASRAACSVHFNTRHTPVHELRRGPCIERYSNFLDLDGQNPSTIQRLFIFRKAHVQNFPKRAVAEVSKILSEKWRNTSKEEQDHYKALAQEAKQKHTAERPGYKFTSAKRGTGKRALKLAAETAAAKKAKMEAPTFSTPMAVPSIVFIPTTSNSNVRRKV